jgi:hypothetical protein
VAFDFGLSLILSEALNSPNEVAAEIFLYRNGIFTIGNITASIYSQKFVLK